MYRLGASLFTAGALLGTFTTTFGSNSDVVVDSQGNIWVANQDSSNVMKFSP